MFWYTGIFSNASHYFGRTVKMVWGCSRVLTVLRQHFSMQAPCQSEGEPAGAALGLERSAVFPVCPYWWSPCAGPLLWGGLDHCWAHSASLLPVSAGGAPERRQPPLCCPLPGPWNLPASDVLAHVIFRMLSIFPGGSGGTWFVLVHQKLDILVISPSDTVRLLGCFSSLLCFLLFLICDH